MSRLRKSVRHASFSGLGTLGQFVVQLFFAGFTIRILGDQRAGFIILLNGLIAFGSGFGGLGLGTSAVRKIASLSKQDGYPEMRRSLGVVFLFNLVYGCIIAILVIIFAPKIIIFSKLDMEFRSDAMLASVFITLTFVTSQLENVCRSSFTAFQRFDILALYNTMSGFLGGALGIIALSLFPTITTLAILSFFLGVAQFSVGYVISRRLLRGFVLPIWDLSEFRSLIKFGGWVYGESIARLLTTQLDKIVLTAYLGSAALPYYNIGQRLFWQIHTAIGNNIQFLFPMLASEGKQVEAVILQVQDRLRWFITTISAIIYGGMAMISYPLLATIVNKEFADIAQIFVILACVQGFFHAQNMVPYQLNWARGDGRINTILTFINNLLVCGTFIVFIPKIGILGASLSQLWIGPIAFIWVLWSLRIVGIKSLILLLRPMFSPIVILLICGFTVFFIWNSEVTIVYPVTVALSLSVAVIAALVIEKFFFARYRCLTTLKEAIGILTARIGINI